MAHIYFDTRRLFAASALVLASSLQICGCNPPPDCERLLQFQLSSLALEGQIERCARCLTAKQMTLLVRAPDRSLPAGATARLRSEATIRQILLGEEISSFYDPSSSPTSRSTAPDATAAEGYAGTDVYPSPVRPVTQSGFGLTTWPISDSVFFIYRSTDNAGEARPRAPIAAAFILTVPDVNHRTLARFMVTARHVVDPEWAHCSDRNPASVEVGLNLQGGGVVYESLPLGNTPMQRLFTPSDGTSDIAIIRLDERLIPGLGSYKFVDTPFRLLPTGSELRTIAAHPLPIVTASLPPHAQTSLNVFPVSGRGVLSSTTGETVDIHCGSNPAARSLDVWFIGGSFQQGVGGAPVYTSLVRNGESTATTVLLGIQAVAWPDRGMAGITPSVALADLIQTALASQTAQADFHRGAMP